MTSIFQQEQTQIAWRAVPVSQPFAQTIPISRSHHSSAEQREAKKKHGTNSITICQDSHKRKSIFRKLYLFHTTFLHGLSQKKLRSYITAATSLCGYGENRQVVKTNEDKSLIAHNFVKQNCLGQDFAMLLHMATFL